jgi:hypothetical protein
MEEFIEVLVVGDFFSMDTQTCLGIPKTPIASNGGSTLFPLRPSRQKKASMPQGMEANLGRSRAAASQRTTPMASRWPAL